MAKRKRPVRKTTPSHDVQPEEPMRDEQLFKYPMAAARLSMSLNTLRARIREGRIAVVYTGPQGPKSKKGRRISGAEIRRFIEANQIRSIAPAQ